MKRCLLSVDWDYFIATRGVRWCSYAESKKNIINLWYKRYLLSKYQGRDIRKSYRISAEAAAFWPKIRQNFRLGRNAKVYVSDSHALSYWLAKKHKLGRVYSFDAHADLGYGGLSSLQFEVNCANWLGKLLAEGVIQEANIIYSPYTKEKPEDFKQINDTFPVRYRKWDSLNDQAVVAVIHICRSGAWTPPWYDKKFHSFIMKLELPFQEIDFYPRRWDTNHLNMAAQIDYLIS